MNRIDRLIGLLIMLQSRKYVTAEKIAEKYQISIRTVYRDIKALGEQGVPVSFEPHKGYFVVQGYFLPPVSFSTEEVNALLLMETMVKGFTDRSIIKYYSSALDKIKAVLKHHQKENLEYLHQHIKMQIPACIENNFEYLTVLQNAISSGSQIKIEYKNNKEEISIRCIEPLGLIFYALHWHLIGWCHSKNDYRDFRITRILNLVSLEIPFIKKDHISINDYMKLLPVNY
jgi:predicted DNA-binding transcriptional regulator YafY